MVGLSGVSASGLSISTSEKNPTATLPASRYVQIISKILSDVNGVDSPLFYQSR